MTEKQIKIGARVEISGKDVQGKVAYVGSTHFSSGKWVGVILDEPKGKNNGTVQGKAYFHCKETHGIFVRQSQLNVLDENTSFGNGSGETPNMSTSGTSSTSATTPGTTPGTTPATTPGSEDNKRIYRLSHPKTPTGEMPPFKEDDLSKRSTPLTASSSASGSKRASFVEQEQEHKNGTNFVETVTHNYTPSVGALEERVAALQQQQEMETLHAEVKDLQEKLETLKVKRAQDKEKLKELEKTKIQLQQLQEFKSKIMESQTELQRELQKAKLEAKTAIEEKERHAEEMSDLAEAVEMATLDREMAEEKSETLQADVDHLKERVEELTLDLEILKNEISEKGKEGAATNFQTKQLQQQNERLKEALVKLRDLSAHDKQEQQRMQKEIDRQRSELSELSRIKEKLSSQIEEYEKQIGELKEQVDAALGAEEMVEQLTEKNLNLEEKISELMENVNDLEALHDMNEELQENARETELELREEIDMSNGRVRELQHKIEASQETVADYMDTIQKFRELTENLKERNREITEQLEKVTNVTVQPPTDLYDFKIKFAETRAFTKAIEMELRRIEVQQANQHVNYLCAFMPDEFLSRGGDHDAVLILLLIPRIVWKAEILISQVREKFRPPEAIERESVLKGHSVEQYSFGCTLIHLLLSLQTLLHQYISALNSCSVQLFLKLGLLYPELAVQEKAVDFYIDLIKKDQLDENVLLDPLEKSLAFFHHQFGLHLSEERIDCTVLMTDHTKLMAAASECISTEIQRIRVLMEKGKDSEEMMSLLKDLENYNDEIRQMAKKIKRRLPQEGAPNPISFEKEVQTQLMECNLHIGRVVRTLRELGLSSVQQTLTVADSGAVLSNQKLKELAHLASDKIYGKDDSGPLDCLRHSMTTIIGNVTKLSSRVQEGEFDFDGTPEPLRQPPLQVRAQTIKAEIKDVENIKLKLEAREADILELKKNLKLKSEELSEITVRKDMAEKKLDTITKENDQKLLAQQQQLEAATLLLKKKEKEFEQTMDHLQADIDALENERSDLKEKLKSISKKALFENLTKTSIMGSLTSPTSPTVPSLPGGPVVVKDSPLLLQQISNLRNALKRVRMENVNLKAQKMKAQLADLPPLIVPKKPTGLSSTTGFINFAEQTEQNTKLGSAAREASSLLNEINDFCVNVKVVDISKRKPATEPALDKEAPVHHLTENIRKYSELQKRTEKLQVEVTNFLAEYRTGGKVFSDFSAFPTPQYTRVLQEGEEGLKHIGRVIIPQKQGSGCQTVNVVLDPPSLKQLHELMTVY